jgi:hypothetical protein
VCRKRKPETVTSVLVLKTFKTVYDNLPFLFFPKKAAREGREKNDTIIIFFQQKFKPMFHFRGRRCRTSSPAKKKIHCKKK